MDGCRNDNVTFKHNYLCSIVRTKVIFVFHDTIFPTVRIILWNSRVCFCSFLFAADTDLILFCIFIFFLFQEYLNSIPCFRPKWSQMSRSMHWSLPEANNSFFPYSKISSKVPIDTPLSLLIFRAFNTVLVTSFLRGFVWSACASSWHDSFIRSSFSLWLWLCKASISICCSSSLCSSSLSHSHNSHWLQIDRADD